MDYSSLRNVAANQIYESYMGILRISPDTYGNDDMTTTLMSPSLDAEGNVISTTGVILSDSDGNMLGNNLNFVPRAKMTNVYTDDGKDIYKAAVVFISSYCYGIYAKETLNIRNTLMLNGITDISSVISPLRCYYDTGAQIGAVYYPIESPNDSNYFNNKRSMFSKLDGFEEMYEGTTLNSPTNGRYEYVNDFLYNQEPTWYEENFNTETLTDEYVKVSNEIVTYKNVKNKSIPVVRTRDYVLGHYNAHSGNAISSSKWFSDDTGNSTEKFTKLSWLDIDKIVWDEIEGIINGNSRHYSGRYRSQGTDYHSLINPLYGADETTSYVNKSIRKYENDFNLLKSAPILGVSIQPGLIVYNAMPLRRLLFHTARQELLNATEEYETDDYGLTTLADYSKFTYDESSDATITPIERYAPGFVNNLTKNFLLCTGDEISYKNYPNINLYNTNLYERASDLISVKIINNNGYYEPEMKDFSNISDNDISVNYKIYNAIANSSIIKETLPSDVEAEEDVEDTNTEESDNPTFKTPQLFRFIKYAGQNKYTDTYYLTTRYLRGLNWHYEGGSDFIWDSYTSNCNDMEAPTSLPILLVPGIPSSWYSNTGNYTKHITNVGSYPINYNFYEKNYTHYHNSFANVNMANKSSQRSMWKTSSTVPYSGRQEYFYNELTYSGYSTTRTGSSINRWISYSFDNFYQKYRFNPSWNSSQYYSPVKTAGRYYLSVGSDGEPLRQTASSFEDYLSKLKSLVKTKLYLNNGLGETIDTSSTGLEIYYALQKMDESDARSPLAYMGGSYYDGIQGYYHCRVHHGMSRRRREYWWTDGKGPRGLGYEMKGSAYSSGTAQDNGEIARCISSLPFTDQDTLGQTDSDGIRYDITDDFGINSISVHDIAPRPPSLNLLPLIRI